MNKYLVISYDVVEREVFHDIVLAANDCGALSMIGGLRMYVVPIEAFSEHDLAAEHADIRAITMEEAQAHLAELAKHKAEP